MITNGNLASSDEPVKFENFDEDVEVALLLTLEMIVQNLNELGAGGSWHCFHQLKLLYKKAVLEGKTQLAHNALRFLHGNLCGFLPSRIMEEIYEP